MAKSPHNRGLNITGRLLIWFLIIAFLPLLVVTSIDYYISVKHLENQASNYLATVADYKVDKIESYFRERKLNLSSLSHMPSISDALSRLRSEDDGSGHDASEHQAIENEFRTLMTSYQEEAGFYDILLIDVDGFICFTLAKEADYHTNLKTGPYKDSQLARVFDNAGTLMQADISSLEFYAPSSQPAAFIAIPIMREGVVVGVVAVQIDNEELFSIVNDYAGLGETGEVIVAKKVDNEAVFAAPTRHESDAAMNRKVGFGSNKGLPIQKAVKGSTGFGSDIDYRGSEVLAAWRYVPSIQWGLVAKIDATEAFASVAQLRTAVILLGIITLIAVVLAALAIAKSFSEPIKKLMRMTELIASGDLSAQVEIESKGEIGQLAHNFNTMLTGLQRSQA